MTISNMEKIAKKCQKNAKLLILYITDKKCRTFYSNAKKYIKNRNNGVLGIGVVRGVKGVRGVRGVRAIGSDGNWGNKSEEEEGKPKEEEGNPKEEKGNPKEEEGNPKEEKGNPKEEEGNWKRKNINWWSVGKGILRGIEWIEKDTRSIATGSHSVGNISE